MTKIEHITRRLLDCGELTYLQAVSLTHLLLFNDLTGLPDYQRKELMKLRESFIPEDE